MTARTTLSGMVAIGTGFQRSRGRVLQRQRPPRHVVQAQMSVFVGSRDPHAPVREAQRDEARREQVPLIGRVRIHVRVLFEGRDTYAAEIEAVLAL